MDIDCPKCNEANEVDGDDLPDRACDDSMYKCINCEHEFLIGWYAEVELR